MHVSKMLGASCFAAYSKMTVGQILFSFNGRVNRAKYWLCVFLPSFILVIAGMLIGGILVAQSMISTAKVQSFCRESGANYGGADQCKALSILNIQYTMTQNATKSTGVTQNPAEFCESNKSTSGFTGSCDQFEQFRNDFQAKYPNAAASATAPAETAPAHSSLGVLAGVGMVMGLVMAVIGILYAWICLAVTAKRLHDRELSGWWQFGPIAISFIGSLLTLAISPVLGGVFSIISIIGSLIIFIICGFLKGTTGANKYGADPLQPNTQGVVA